MKKHMMRNHMMKNRTLIIHTKQNDKVFILKRHIWGMRNPTNKEEYDTRGAYDEESSDEESYDGARRQAETLLKTIRWAAKKLTNGACDCPHCAIDHCAKCFLLCNQILCKEIVPLFIVQLSAVQKLCKRCCTNGTSYCLHCAKDCALFHCVILHCAKALCNWAQCKRCCTNGTGDCMHCAKDCALFHCEIEHCQMSFQMNVNK